MIPKRTLRNDRRWRSSSLMFSTLSFVLMIWKCWTPQFRYFLGTFEFLFVSFIEKYLLSARMISPTIDAHWTEWNCRRSTTVKSPLRTNLRIACLSSLLTLPRWWMWWTKPPLISFPKMPTPCLKKTWPPLLLWWPLCAKTWWPTSDFPTTIPTCFACDAWLAPSFCTIILLLLVRFQRSPQFLLKVCVFFSTSLLFFTNVSHFVF